MIVIHILLHLWYASGLTGLNSSTSDADVRMNMYYEYT